MNKRIFNLHSCITIVWACLFLMAACGSDEDNYEGNGNVGIVGGWRQPAEELPGTKSYFDLSDAAGFYDLPYPTDIRRTSGKNSSLDLSTYPVHDSPIVKQLYKNYIQLAAGCKGFSRSTVIYFLFEAPIMINSLPANPLDTVTEEAVIFLQDIDPLSPELGRRLPLIVRFFQKPGSYHPGNLLALMPIPGIVLRANTQYVAIILRDLNDAKGAALGSPLIMQQLLHGEIPGGPKGEGAAKKYQNLVTFLQTHEVSPRTIAAATVFTTGDPVADTGRIYNHVVSLPVPGLSSPLERTREYNDYYLLEAFFPIPFFQRGVPPYLFGGGDIVFDDNGIPVKQGEEHIPVSVAVPAGKMPPKGWPLMIYIHGTGGVATQLADRGRLTDPDQGAPEGSGPALTFSKRGIATAGAALPVNPQRGGNADGWTFYNIFQPPVLKDNLRQAVAEQALFLRMLKELTIDPELCPNVDASAAPDGKIKFDPDLIFGMGQSLGSIVLDIWAAYEENLVAIIPSGTAAHFGAIALEMRFIPTGDLLSLFLTFPEGDFDLFHPFLNLILLGWGAADPVNFAGHHSLEPLPGRKPKHSFLTQGFFDAYFPPPTQNPFIIASGLQLAGALYDAVAFDEIASEVEYDSPRCGFQVPCVRSTVELMEMLGKEILDYPVSENLFSSDGTQLTGVVVQYLEDGIMDGHHVNYQLDETKYQYGCFLRTLIDTGIPVIAEPRPLDASCP